MFNHLLYIGYPLFVETKIPILGPQQNYLNPYRLWLYGDLWLLDRCGKIATGM